MIAADDENHVQTGFIVDVFNINTRWLRAASSENAVGEVIALYPPISVAILPPANLPRLGHDPFAVARPRNSDSNRHS